MILADTSIWINHWMVTNLNFARLLAEQQVAMHPLVLGELAMGSLKDRRRTLADLKDFYTVQQVPHDEVLALIERHRLFSRGVGYNDIHLIAAALANPPVKILTRDGRFHRAAEELGVAT